MTDVFSASPGQERAVAALRVAAASPLHAYLVVGGPGTGSDEVVHAFAAALVCPDGGCGTCEHCLAALAEEHPDVAFFRREGASIRVEQLKEAVQRSLRAPRSARRQVLVLEELHLVGDGAPVLLKAVEEPPASTVFVLAAEEVSPPLVTIASRCARVDLAPLPAESLIRVLVADGIAPETAAAAAAAAGGRVDRARLLAHDDGFAIRTEAWSSVPGRLDGSGSTVVELATGLLGGIDELVGVLKGEHDAEMAALEARAAAAGERAVRGRAAIVARQRREQRRVRTDELRAGLATLASSYRERLGAPDGDARLGSSIRAVRLIDEATSSLDCNPNEELLLKALFLQLAGDA
ncbi:MAG TPA: hypothetical protein VGS21_10590 [Acidimicrobiales bacterium]|nr:hypothetical protein [Acidimicrobiales bacterium]